MLVAELAGKIKVLPPPYTTPEPAPFLQINNVGSAGVQQGIFDIALDPDFAINHYDYVFYTSGSPNVDRVSRFTATRHHRDGSRAARSFSTRIPKSPTPNTTVAPCLRQRREALLHDRRTFPGLPLAGSEQPAGQDPSHQPGWDGAHRQPVLRRRRAALGLGVGLRTAEPLPRLLRRADRQAVHRGRRRQRPSDREGGARPRRTRRQLRLAGL